MSYKVAIRNNETNEMRFYVVTDDDWNDEYVWLYTEGNYSCDCNREIFFNRAAGIEIDISEAKCSEGKYSVPYIELPDQTRIDID